MLADDEDRRLDSVTVLVSSLLQTAQLLSDRLAVETHTPPDALRGHG
jgi:hypothetical protein